MDTMSSAEFRRKYAGLAQTTLVTVNGHVIGRWTPIGTSDEVRTYSDDDGARTIRVERDPVRFNTQPFTGPIPKSGKR